MLERTQRSKMTDYEREEFDQEKTVVQMQLEHTQKLKEMELEVSRLEAKSAWTHLLKVPLYIIKLPVLLLFGVAYIVASAKGDEMEPEFWNFLLSRDR